MRLKLLVAKRLLQLLVYNCLYRLRDGRRAAATHATTCAPHGAILLGDSTPTKQCCVHVPVGSFKTRPPKVFTSFFDERFVVACLCTEPQSKTRRTRERAIKEAITTSVENLYNLQLTNMSLGGITTRQNVYILFYTATLQHQIWQLVR